MKSFLFFLVALSMVPHANAQQSCADSVKWTYFYHEENNSTTYSVTVDTFSLDSGWVRTCSRSGDDPATLGNDTCSSGYWSKNEFAFNPHGDTSVVLTKTGSAAGWKDQSRRTFLYNGNNQITSLSYETWNGSSWIQTSLYSWTYDVSSHLVSQSYQEFSSGNTINVSKTSWTYSGNM